MTLSVAQYAFASQAMVHGLNPKDAVIELSPRSGEFYLRDQDILKAIKEQGPSLALVIFPGIQYYTGQAFDIQAITKAAHDEVISPPNYRSAWLTKSSGSNMCLGSGSWRWQSGAPSPRLAG